MRSADTENKVGEALRAQRFQMLEDIAQELSSNTVVFPICFDAVFKLRKELQNPEITIQRIVSLVSLDPLISAKLLRLANSALYCTDGSPVKHLSAAIVRLGIETVRTTALSIALNEFRLSKEIAQFSELSQSLWTHSIKTAVGARILAHTNEHLNPEVALLAGLVHDLGAFYMLYRAAKYEELRSRPETLKYLIVQWHESIGETLLASLGLPPEVIQATTDHDHPRQPPVVIGTITDAVYVANILVGGDFERAYQGIDPSSEVFTLIHERFNQHLPAIETAAEEMLAIFA